MLKIVIVEDDQMISEIYQKKFSEAGFESLVADSGEQAVNIVQKEKVDVVLLDLILPRMSGFDVIKEIKTGKQGNKIKVIVFSNLNQSDDQKKAMELGADGFIIKAEFTPSNLVKEVERLISQFGEETKNEEKLNKDKVEANVAPSPKDSKIKKVLMIEDEQVFLEMFGEKLEQDGFDVTCADNGAWGIKEALRDCFDLIIVDMVMPAMGGEEIVAKLKLEDKTKNIPIIVLSASVDEDTKKRVEGMGIDAFFVKTQIIPSELSKKAIELLK